MVRIPFIAALFIAVMSLLPAAPAFSSQKAVFTTKDIKLSDQHYVIEVDYPEARGLGDRKAEDAFNRTMKTYIDNQIGDFRKEIASRLAKGEKQIIRWSLFINHTVEFSSARAISVIFGGTCFTGGAHPFHPVKTINFDIKRQKPCTLADLFKKGEEYLKPLSAYCVNELREKLGNSLWEQGASPEAKNYERFTLGDEGITIWFPEYQVAAYVAGGQQVLVPYEAVKNSIDPEGPAGAFVGR